MQHTLPLESDKHQLFGGGSGGSSDFFPIIDFFWKKSRKVWLQAGSFEIGRPVGQIGCVIGP
jgi:hypothetical protein